MLMMIETQLHGSKHHIQVILYGKDECAGKFDVLTPTLNWKSTTSREKFVGSDNVRQFEWHSRYLNVRSQSILRPRKRPKIIRIHNRCPTTGVLVWRSGTRSLKDKGLRTLTMCPDSRAYRSPSRIVETPVH